MKPNKRLQPILIAIIVMIIAFTAFAFPFRLIDLAEGKVGLDDTSRFSHLIDYLNQLLSNEKITNETREKIELRKQYFEWQATRMAKNTENPESILAQKQTLAVEATKEYSSSILIPTSSRPVGIMKGIDYIRSLEKEAALSEIFWVGKINDVYVIMYTGVLRNDSSQGVIFVFPENVGSWIKFLTPNKVGLVTITDFEGTRLKLASDKDDIVFFDVAMQKFIYPSGEIVVTPTKPNYPPYPYP